MKKPKPPVPSPNNRPRQLNPEGLVTIEMVAKAAGVSLSTVSRILNGTAGVREAKREAVDKAIAELGFVPNPIARGLAGGRSMSIGVITQAIDSPFYGAALRGIEETLDPAGFSPLFVSGHWNAATEARCITMLHSRRVDGIIVLTGRLSDQALADCALQLPVVATGRTLSSPGLYTLNFDNFEGARLATQHLTDLGHKQIAFISGEDEHPDATERLRGYRAALEEAGLAFEPKLVVPGAYHEVSGMLAVENLLSSRQPFSAIFAANDQMAVGAALALHKRSLRVPDDVSLVGFDDMASSQFSLPPLTTVHQPNYELGQLAAQAMLQLLAGEEPQIEMPAPRLVRRDSCKRMRG
ncbi:transcriptional regulator [Paucibacter sp. KBW04]|nr:transcriptional regulator [Paucibacter sp. KBW04]